jgi:hypothetical protein
MAFHLQVCWEKVLGPKFMWAAFVQRSGEGAGKIGAHIIGGDRIVALVWFGAEGDDEGEVKWTHRHYLSVCFTLGICCMEASQMLACATDLHLIQLVA